MRLAIPAIDRKQYGYQASGLVSLGRAAELAGLTEQEMILQARAAGIQPRWSQARVEEELA